MDVLHFTSRKRETYQVELKCSILWECALGIAAITNTPIIKTLEKPEDYWREIKESMSKELLEDLDYVEQNNTWKALLQLLHQNDFTDLTDFTLYIQALSFVDLKYICLPFAGQTYQEIRKRTASGEQEAMETLMEITSYIHFFPKYIEYICNADEEQLKNHLIRVMRGWFDLVIKKDSEQRLTFLQTDVEIKAKMGEKMSPEELVEWATGGITYLPEPNVHQVLLIPQYIYRPWNIEADLEGIKVFYYPVANESISPNDRYTPNNFLVLKYKALGDEVRLRIVKMLYEQNRTLQDITEQLDIGKSTIHHHLKILKAAKLVETIDAKYSLKKRSIELLAKEMGLYFEQ